MPRSENSPFELEVRHGVRQIKSMEYDLLLFGGLCIAVQAVAIVVVPFFFGLHLYGRTIDRSPGAMQISLIFTILSNRPTMFFALRALTATEAIIEENRIRQRRGWKGVFLDLCPWSALLPPGELLAITMFLLLVRLNTDNLNQRQTRIYQWSARGLAIGAVAQYLGLVLLFGLLALRSMPFDLPFAYLTACANAMVLGGVAGVILSLRSMRRELTDIVCQSHWESDPATTFLAGITIADPPRELALIQETTPFNAEFMPSSFKTEM